MNVKIILKRFIPRRLSTYRYLRHHPMPMNLSDKEREEGVKKLYERKMGRKLDFSNLRRFTEKLQWYKLYYYHPDLSRIVCKYGFKNYVAEKLGEGHTVPLIGAWSKVEDIPWDKLPDRFVFKSNCQSDGNFIKFIKSKDECSFDEIKQELRNWLNPRKTLLNSYCRAYYDVTPMIIAETYLQSVEDQLVDYKLFCFSGKPRLFYAGSNHFHYREDGTLDYAVSFYDTDWNKMNYAYGDHRVVDIPKPKHLNTMLEYATILSKDFPFVRVDFFDTDEKLYLAELTFYPGGGVTSYSNDLDEKLGDMFILPRRRTFGHKYRLDLTY